MNNRIKIITKRNVWHILKTPDNRPVQIVLKAMLFALFLLKEK
jgi:hypothetical protein